MPDQIYVIMSNECDVHARRNIHMLIPPTTEPGYPSFATMLTYLLTALSRTYYLDADEVEYVLFYVSVALGGLRMLTLLLLCSLQRPFRDICSEREHHYLYLNIES